MLDLNLVETHKSISYYYEGASKILPYIIAPLPDIQDNFLLAPKNLVSDQREFINQTSLPPEQCSGKPYARAYSYNEYVNIYIVFPTTEKEELSGRLGLDFVIGILIEKSFFKDYSLIHSLFKLFIHKIYENLNVDLFSDGANSFIAALQLKDQHQIIHDRLISLSNNLESLFFLFKRTSKNYFYKIKYIIFKFIKSQNKFSFPNVILCIENERPLDIILDFFIGLDKFILRNENFDISDTSLKAVFHVVVLPIIPTYLGDFQKVVNCKNLKNRPIIALFKNNL